MKSSSIDIISKIQSNKIKFTKSISLINKNSLLQNKKASMLIKKKSNKNNCITVNKLKKKYSELKDIDDGLFFYQQDLKTYMNNYFKQSNNYKDTEISSAKYSKIDDITKDLNLILDQNDHYYVEITNNNNNNKIIQIRFLLHNDELYKCYITNNGRLPTNEKYNYLLNNKSVINIKFLNYNNIKILIFANQNINLKVRFKLLNKQTQSNSNNMLQIFSHVYSLTKNQQIEEKNNASSKNNTKKNNNFIITKVIPKEKKIYNVVLKSVMIKKQNNIKNELLKKNYLVNKNEIKKTFIQFMYYIYNKRKTKIKLKHKWFQIISFIKDLDYIRKYKLYLKNSINDNKKTIYMLYYMIYKYKDRISNRGSDIYQRVILDSNFTFNMYNCVAGKLINNKSKSLIIMFFSQIYYMFKFENRVYFCNKIILKSISKLQSYVVLVQQFNNKIDKFWDQIFSSIIGNHFNQKLRLREEYSNNLKQEFKIFIKKQSCNGFFSIANIERQQSEICMNSLTNNNEATPSKRKSYSLRFDKNIVHNFILEKFSKYKSENN